MIFFFDFKKQYVRIPLLSYFNIFGCLMISNKKLSMIIIKGKCNFSLDLFLTKISFLLAICSSWSRIPLPNSLSYFRMFNFKLKNCRIIPLVWSLFKSQALVLKLRVLTDRPKSVWSLFELYLLFRIMFFQNWLEAFFVIYIMLENVICRYISILTTVSFQSNLINRLK